MKSTLSIFMAMLVLCLPASASELTGGSTTASASILKTCLLVTNPAVDFGNYRPIGANSTEDKVVTSTVSLRCTIGTIASVGVGPGLHNIHNCVGDTSRRLKHASVNQYIRYGIYMDEEQMVPMGCLPSDRYYLPSSPSSIENVDVPLYLVLPAGLNSKSGKYSDTVMISVLF